LLILTDMTEQVVELFRAPTSAGCCCSGVTKMPVLRQRHNALAVSVAARLRHRSRKNYVRMVFETIFGSFLRRPPNT
jgi:hypothetical protein